MVESETSQPSGRTRAVSPGTWIRSRRRTVVFSAYAFLLSGFWIAMIFVVASNRAAYEANGGLAVFVVLFLALAIPSAILGVRLARSGVWIDSEEVVVRGPLRTREIPAERVTRFEPGVKGPGNGTPCPTIVLSDGRSVGVWALGSEALRVSFERHLEDMGPICDALDGALAAARGTTAAARATAG